MCASPARAATSGGLTQVKGRAGCLRAQVTKTCGTLRPITREVDDARWAVTRDRRGAVGVLTSNAQGQSLVSLVRDPRTGALRQARGAGECVNASGRGGCVRDPGVTGVFSAAVSDDGRVVALAENPTGNSFVRLLRRDPASGALQPTAAGACAAAKAVAGCPATDGLATGAVSVEMAPDGRSLYTTGQDRIAIFAVDPAAGTLTQPATQAPCLAALDDPDAAHAAGTCAQVAGLSGGSAIGLTLAPDGREMVADIVGTPGDEDTPAAGGSVVVLPRDPQTGALSALPGAAGCYRQGNFDGATSPDYPNDVGRPSGPSGPAGPVPPSAKAPCTYAPIGAFLDDVEITDHAVVVLGEGADVAARYSVLARGPDGTLSAPKTLDVGGEGYSFASGLIRGDQVLYLFSSPNTTDGDGDATTPQGSVRTLDLGGDGLSPTAPPAGCLSSPQTDQCGDGSRLGVPEDLAVTGDGRHAYVGSELRRRVSVLSRDPGSGALRFRGCLGAGRKNAGKCVALRGLSARIGIGQIVAGDDAKHVALLGESVLNLETR